MTIYTGTAIGVLTINPGGVVEGETEVVFPCPAWGGDLDVSILWGPPDLRGSNTVIPGLSGRRARPRRIDETVFSLPFTIIGEVDAAGDPYADRHDGLQLNVDFLIANVHNPPDLPAATRSAELLMPDGSIRAADVQCALRLGDHVDATIRAVLEVTAPAGRFVDEGT